MTWLIMFVVAIRRDLFTSLDMNSKILDLMRKWRKSNETPWLIGFYLFPKSNIRGREIWSIRLSCIFFDFWTLIFDFCFLSGLWEDYHAMLMLASDSLCLIPSNIGMLSVMCWMGMRFLSGINTPNSYNYCCLLEIYSFLTYFKREKKCEKRV